MPLVPKSNLKTDTMCRLRMADSGQGGSRRAPLVASCESLVARIEYGAGRNRRTVWPGGVVLLRSVTSGR